MSNLINDILVLGARIQHLDATTHIASITTTLEPASWSDDLKNIEAELRNIQSTAESTDAFADPFFAIRLKLCRKDVAKLRNNLSARVQRAEKNCKCHAALEALRKTYDHTLLSGSLKKHVELLTSVGSLMKSDALAHLTAASLYDMQQRLETSAFQLMFQKLDQVIDQCKELPLEERGAKLNPLIQALPKRMAGELYEDIWKAAGSPLDGDFQYAEHHVGEHLDTLKQSVKTALEVIAI